MCRELEVFHKKCFIVSFFVFLELDDQIRDCMIFVGLEERTFLLL